MRLAIQAHAGLSGVKMQVGELVIAGQGLDKGGKGRVCEDVQVQAWVHARSALP